MPTAPRRYTPHGFVESNSTSRDHTYTSHQRGYTRAWYRAALNYIAEQVAIDPRCRICLCIPKHQPHRRPYEVDHITAPSSAGPPGSQTYIDLFWDQRNWRLSCVSCNARKQNN